MVGISAIHASKSKHTCSISFKIVIEKLALQKILKTNILKSFDVIVKNYIAISGFSATKFT